MLQGIIGTMGNKWAKDGAAVQGAAPHSQEFAEKLAKAQAEADAKILADIEPGSGTQKSAVQDFLAYQAMSIPEKIRISYLASKNLSEEDLQAMTPEDRERVENDIRDAIKRKLDPNHS